MESGSNNKTEDPIDATMVSPSSVKSKPKRKRRPPATPWRKPADMPKRYLSAYNLFYREERERMLKAGKGSQAESLSEGGEIVVGETDGGMGAEMTVTPRLPDPDAPKNATRKHARSSGIGFANLTRIVAENWKNLDPALKAPFEEVAKKDKERYQRQMVEW